MKFLFVTILLVSSLAFKKSENEKAYSCNSDINTYVVKNVKKLSNIKLIKLNKYGLLYQQAIFRSLTADSRKTIWLERLSTLSNSTSMWDKSETESLKQLIELVKGIEFNHVLNDNDNQLITQWVNKTKVLHSWTPFHYLYILSSLSLSAQKQSEFENILIKETENAAKIDISENSPGEKSNSKCDCRVSFSGCNILHQCVPDGCAVTDYGCGGLWLQSCNGSCYVGASDTQP